MQPPRHAHRQGTLALQDIGCALARTEQAAEIGLGKAAHLHAVADRIDRIRRFDRPALALIVLDDQCEKIETIGVRSARLRFAFEISLDLIERGVIVGLGAKHADYFFRHDTVSGSMRSHSACSPISFTRRRPNVKDTAGTSRRREIPRLSPTKSTVAPNWRFISVGFAQCAAAAMASHARIGLPTLIDETGELLPSPS